MIDTTTGQPNLSDGGNRTHESPSLLLTGQFWHTGFADLVNRLTVPTTLMKLEQFSTLRERPGKFDLALVCKERRGSVSQTAIDRIRQLLPETPIVALLGSWCEGEERTGQPLRDVTSVYWHQWHGSYDQLAALAGVGSIPGHQILSGTPAGGPPPVLAISAHTREQFEMLAEAVQALGGAAVWLEQASWQADSLERVTGILVDNDGISAELSGRIELVRTLCPDRPVICILGFPRKQEVLRLRAEWGIQHVLSKPFDLGHLYHAVREGCGVELPVLPPGSANSPPNVPPLTWNSQTSPSLPSNGPARR